MLAEMPGTPATKDYFLRAIRGLLRSGIPSMMREDPTDGIVVKRPKTDGHCFGNCTGRLEQWRLVLEFALEGAPQLPRRRRDDMGSDLLGANREPALDVPRPRRCNP